MKNPKPLDQVEMWAFDDALEQISQNAHEHCRLRPAMSTMLEEMAEAILAARGKHEHELMLEIEQIGGIAINILWQLRLDRYEHVCNIGGERSW